MFDMAYPAYIKEKARELRLEKKLTIDELVEHLAVPRTTVYEWVRDLPIPRKPANGWPESARRKGTAAMRAKYKALRQAAYEQGRREFSVLAKRPTFRDFVCMYIGEGYKRDRNRVSICNSDPAVVRLGAHWICKLASNPVAYELQYHADQNPADLCRFWGQLLAIDPAAIGIQRKSNSGQLKGRIWRSRFGVLQVRSADTCLRARLEAWMDEVRSDWP